jgi:hypothetical protein
VAAWSLELWADSAGYHGRLSGRECHRRRLGRRAAARVPQSRRTQDGLDHRHHPGCHHRHVLLLLQPRQEQAHAEPARRGTAQRHRGAAQAAGDAAGAAHAVQHAGEPARADHPRPAARRGDARPAQQLLARDAQRLAHAGASALGRVRPAGRLPRTDVGAHGRAPALHARPARRPPRHSGAAAAPAAAGGKQHPPWAGAQGRRRRNRRARAQERGPAAHRSERHRRRARCGAALGRWQRQRLRARAGARAPGHRVRRAKRDAPCGGAGRRDLRDAEFSAAAAAP